MESDVQPADDVDPGVTPDIMNDSAFTPLPKSTQKSSEEVDSCRICRGDGTTEEPLFYPCKCSGSIKFVHQDCLMEWLSHSQKKHCELCKTPFRFTKLYHPQMPQTLPTTVFLRKALSHIVRGFFTWCRGVLVASVWLFWLPWSMRFVWWGLFWIGDGGWVRTAGTPIDVSNGFHDGSWSDGSASLQNSSAHSVQVMLKNSSSPFGSLFRHPLLQLVQLPRLVHALWNTDHGYQPVSTKTLSSNNSTSQLVGGSAGESLLSAIPFFQNLTSSPVLNKIVTDILEGQIITLAVVVAFVLVFLIREWVVQQQPVLNLGVMNQLEGNNRREVFVDAREAGDPAAEEEQPAVEETVPADESNANSGHVRNSSSEEEKLELSALEQIDRLVGENCARHVAHQSLDDKIEPGFAERKHVEKLTAEMDDTITNFVAQSDFDASDWDCLDCLESAIGKHAIEVRKCLLAIQDISSQALEDEDSDLLNTTLESARLLKEGVLRCMPLSLKNDVIEPAEKTEQWIHVGGQMLTSRKDLEKSQRELAELKSEYTHKLKQLSESINDSLEQISVDEGNASLPSQHRPTMPARSQSSVAAEIRRGLEEMAHSSLGANEHSIGPSNNSVDKAGNGSSGSGQPIKDLDDYIPSANQASQTQLKRKVSAEDIASTQETSNANQDVREIRSKNIRDLQYNRQDNATDDSRPHSIAEDPLADFANQGVVQPSSMNQGSNPQEADTSAAPEGIPRGRANLLNGLWDWIWGDITPLEPEQPERENDDEHIVENVADEAPFVPFIDAVPQERFANQINDDDSDDEEGNEIPEEAGMNQNNIEAIDDAEDLEGIMELIGMQGPLAGLFQNSVFCAVLISATVTSAVWFPYLWGKIVLVFLANPVQLAVKVPWLLISGLSNFAIDFCLYLGGIILYWVDSLGRFALIPVEWLIPALTGMSSWNGFGKAMADVTESALDRIAEALINTNEAAAPDFYHLSLSSHAALYAIRSNIVEVFVQATALLQLVGSYTTSATLDLTSFPDLFALGRWLSQAIVSAPQNLATLVTWLPDVMQSKTLVSALSAKALPPLLANGKLPPWTTTDRLIAVIAGYAFFASVGALYLKIGTPITNSQRGKRIEAIVAEILQQAGEVLKVILIISIEMLLFPLYCGFLLDIATLPLFENATLGTRFNFLLRSPWTSGFVHWFLGTCYMFHFALFVSMCRKIVRSGVLYFIRDPDDPTFHPVRDVLERNVSSQLRKIGFSALVYGALVILCMGSVVWAVAFAFDGAFPIRWSSDTRLLVFPIDFLIYNTLTPFLMHLLRPTQGLHVIYEWWFRKCARALRLSHFLFGEEREDEEGRQGSSDGEKIIRDGRFVRAPASDQVRVPKGRSVFVEVDVDNKRLDGEPDDVATDGAEGSTNYTKVFVPPWFRLRIGIFVFCLWALTAAAGLGFTVAPLLFGRWAVSLIVPLNAKVNDIYTFSLGITTFGGIFYLGSRYRTWMNFLRDNLLPPNPTLASIAANLRTFTSRSLRVLYVYGALFLFIPSLLALLLEFYFIMPLHAYIVLRQSQISRMSNNDGELQPTNGVSPPNVRDHTIHFLQDWTLGLLYVRILIRIILWRPNTRPARALQAIIVRGWHNPNARLATKCFILPCTILATLALVVPAPLGYLTGRIYVENLSSATMDGVGAAMYHVNAIRFAYPTVLAIAFIVWMDVVVWRAIGTWRRHIRDEVYLIGERLHNFGEMRPPASSKVRKVF